MEKTVQKNKSKNRIVKTCENCICCIYLEQGDMYCDEHEDFVIVYNDFCPTKNYMWCNGKKFIKR